MSVWCQRITTHRQLSSRLQTTLFQFGPLVRVVTFCLIPVLVSCFLSCSIFRFDPVSHTSFTLSIICSCLDWNYWNSVVLVSGFKFVLVILCWRSFWCIECHYYSVKFLPPGLISCIAFWDVHYQFLNDWNTSILVPVNMTPPCDGPQLLEIIHSFAYLGAEY